MSSKQPTTSGFTLIEVLLSVTIIAILVGLSAPVLGSFQTHNDLDITTQAIAGTLRRAQIYSRGVNGNSQWGVQLQATGATLFKGTSYATRDPAYDETTTISTGMSVSGLTTVLYTILDGTPTAGSTGSITLTSNTNETRTLIINAKGTISY